MALGVWVFPYLMGRTVPHTVNRTDSPDGTRGATPPTSLLLAHCAIEERRAVLDALCESRERTLEELADHVVAERRGVEPAAVPSEARDGARVGLYHNHLQQLSESGLVDLDQAGDATRVTLAPTVEEVRVRDLIDAGEGRWETLGVLLGDPRRERVASLLASADDAALSLGDLARAIAALERGEAGAPPETAVESTRVSLHHVHLPKLSNVGVVAYDAEAAEVCLKGLPDAYDTVLRNRGGDVRA